MSSISIKRYSIAFKKQIVKEYESGLSIYALKEKYGITGGDTITSWIRSLSREGLRHKLMVIQQPEEQQRLQELEAKITELNELISTLTLDNFMYQRMIEVAEEELGYELKKKESIRSPKKPKAFKKKRKGRSSSANSTNGST